MLSENPVVIVSAKRSPMGAFLGSLSPLKASDIAAPVIKSLFNNHENLIPFVTASLIGNVLGAGQGQAPARQATLKAGLPHTVPATTLNKMCGSGMQALVLACQQLSLEPNALIVAGGMESMSQAPYLLPKARQGYRLGHGQMLDHLFFDGLEDAYEPGKLMGAFADEMARERGISRERQDDFARTSLARSVESQNKGYFEAEITPIKIADTLVTRDEGPQRAKPEKIALLKPAFSSEGTVTAANSSSIADGAACLLLLRAKRAEELGLKPLAKISAYATYAGPPSRFTTAPINAIHRLLSQNNWSTDDIDCFEINEAFALVTLLAIQALNLDPTKVNRQGGACALGHPIGASGARIVVTLLHTLCQYKLRRGIASLCIGGGEALALALESY